MKALSENTTRKLVESIDSYISQYGQLPWENPLIINNITGHQVNEMTCFGSNGKPYNGGNAILTAVYRMVNSKACKVFYTHKALRDIGAFPSKGSHSIPVFFWSIFYKDEDGKRITEEEYLTQERAGKAVDKIFTLKQWDVFCLEDCTFTDKSKYRNWQELEKKVLRTETTVESPGAITQANKKIVSCEEIIEHYSNHCKIEHVQFMGNNSAGGYSPALDRIRIPEIQYFTSSTEYYSTLFHELTHSTGHESRLNRKSSLNENTNSYAKEELIAEMGAMLLLSQTDEKDNLKTFRNSAQYLKGWSNHIKSNCNEFIQNLFGAIGASKRAVEYILNNGQTA